MKPRSPSHLSATCPGCWVALLLTLLWQNSSLASELRVSTYATAGGVVQYLSTPKGQQEVLDALRPLGVTRLFLEGRRGDEYVSPRQLHQLRDFFRSHGIECSGGIATVPGANFGTRQQGPLGWLNWESKKTQADVAQFFRENAPVFDTLIVDDFYCTGDTSPESQTAKGASSWGDYRRDLLVSLIEPIILRPTQQASPRTQLILKFPQWYDRFHLFGYDPPRMAAPFAEIWVGTEVRNPQTRRMGFVQPTEGYMNFRWIHSIAGKKVRGAWFDHIESSAQNFVDQAYLSVLAGARELTLFHLGDVMENHPGDALLAERLPELRALSAELQRRSRQGIPFYKPSGSSSDDNMYLADYLGMIGLPILPVAEYPRTSSVAIFPFQAEHDSALLAHMRKHLRRGGVLVTTPALVRALGSEAATLAGVTWQSDPQPVAATEVLVDGHSVTLTTPLEMDASLKAQGCDVLLSARHKDGAVPLLTQHAATRGRLCVLNVRTFSELDFGKSGEWLLAPHPLGLPALPAEVANAVRRFLLAPLKLEFSAPAHIALVLAGKAAWAYSFRDDTVDVRFEGQTVLLPAHQLKRLR